MNKEKDLGIKTVLLLEQKMSSGICRSLHARTAYDLRDHPQNYGIHGMELDFRVQRADLMVEWSLHTDWLLRKTRDDEHWPGQWLKQDSFDGSGSITYHSARPTNPGEEIASESCEYIGGKPCFASTRYMDSQKLFDGFLQNPEEVWDELESYLILLEKKVLDTEAKGD